MAVFFLSVYLATASSDLRHNGDTLLRYQTTQSIVEHQRLWLAHPVTFDIRVSRGVGHHLYAFYAPGQAVLMIPLYLAGKGIAHALSLPVGLTTLYASRSLDLFLGVLLALLFFFVARSLGYSQRVSAVLTLIFGLATVAWPDAQSGLEQTQVNLFLLLAVLGAWLFVRDGARPWLALAGTAIGLAVFTRYDALLYVPVVALYPFLHRLRKRQIHQIGPDALVFGATLAPWIAALGWWDYARFGSAFTTGLHESTWGQPFWLGFLGLLVSPGKGILWYLPLVFLLPWTVVPFYRRNPGLAIFFAVLIAVPLLFYSNLLYWHGDPAWGPRYLYTAIPYLILPLGELVCRWRMQARVVQLFAVALIGLSFLLQVAAVSITQWRFWYRLEVMEQTTSQPFQWGARNYHYYWVPRQSPILIQVDDVYQVARLTLGTRKYLLIKHPGPPTVSNPADLYPVNSFAFWWCDPRHPLLGARTRGTIAISLFAVATASLGLLMLELLMPLRTKERRLREVDLVPAPMVES